MGRSWPFPPPCKIALATECAFLLFAVIASTGGPADHSMPLAHELEQAFATRCPFAAPSGRGDRVTAGRDVRRRKGSRMFVYSRGLLETVGTCFPGPRRRGVFTRLVLLFVYGSPRALPTCPAPPLPRGCSSLRWQNDWWVLPSASAWDLASIFPEPGGHGHGHGVWSMGRRGAYVSLLQGSCQGRGKREIVFGVLCRK